MARILVAGEWFEEIASNTFYETEYESIILQHAAVLFPEFVTVPFKHTLTDGYRDAKPDLVLVHKSYREWWIVEVELAHHPLKGHVLPQVSVFANAKFDRSHAEALCRAEPSLNLSQVDSMMKGAQPRVLVVVNAPSPEWRIALLKYDALLATFELFRSSTAQYIYRFNGERPPQVARVATRCKLDPLTPRMLRIASPGVLPVLSGSRMELRLRNGVSTWVRIDAQDTVWLTPVGNNPLAIGREYVLEHLECGEYLLREAGKED